MPCRHRRNPLIIPRPRTWLRFLQETDKTKETAFVRSRAALQLPDRVLLTDNVCAEFKRNDRTVIRFVHLTARFSHFPGFGRSRKLATFTKDIRQALPRMRQLQSLSARGLNSMFLFNLFNNFRGRQQALGSLRRAIKKSCHPDVTSFHKSSVSQQVRRLSGGVRPLGSRV